MRVSIEACCLIAHFDLMTEIGLPSIPTKRYFTIGEVAELCAVKPHVLRYWEQEFSELAPQKRKGNRRYYQHHEVHMVRRIRSLLYEQGFTISGARVQLGFGLDDASNSAASPEVQMAALALAAGKRLTRKSLPAKAASGDSTTQVAAVPQQLAHTPEQRRAVRHELLQIRQLLGD